MDREYPKEHNKSYAAGLDNLEFWYFKETRKNITRDGKGWWWCPKKNMAVKVDGMYKKTVIPLTITNKH